MLISLILSGGGFQSPGHGVQEGSDEGQVVTQSIPILKKFPIRKMNKGRDVSEHPFPSLREKNRRNEEPMNFSFHVPQALSALKAFASAQGLTAESAMASFGEAALPLQFYPETAVHFRAVVDGLGDNPDLTLLSLQKRSEQVAARLPNDFPKDGYDFHETFRTLSRLRERESVLSPACAAGDWWFSGNDTGLLMGGSFCFADGQRGTVAWDTRLPFQGLPFPPSYLFPVPSEASAIGKQPFMKSVKAVKEHIAWFQGSMRREGFPMIKATPDETVYESSYGSFWSRFSLKVKNQDIINKVSYSNSQEEAVGGTQTRFPTAQADDSPLLHQQGIWIRRGRKEPLVRLEQWNLHGPVYRDPHGQSYEALKSDFKLHPQRPQWLFFPGEVLLFEGLPSMHPNEIPLRELIGVMGHAKTAMKDRWGDEIQGRSVFNEIVEPDAPLYRFGGQFGDGKRQIELFGGDFETPYALRSRWRFVFNGDLNIYSIPLSQETLASVETALATIPA
jgi:hypothetical protein